MSSTGRLLQLIDDVASHFETGAAEAAANSTTGSERWIFYIELKTEISILCSRIPPLQDRFKKQQWTTLEDDCEQVSRELLLFLEESLSKGPEQSGDKGHQFFSVAYPNLEKLRREPRGCIIPYLPTRAGQKLLLQRLTDWSKSLSRLSPKNNEPEITKQAKRARPVWSIQNHLSSLHNVLMNRWGCNCEKAHEGLMFLATHRKHQEKNLYIDFDLLIGQSQLGPSSWRQSKIYVETSDCQQALPMSRVRFAPSESSQDPLPKALSEIEAVCMIANAAKATARLNMLVRNSSIWKTRPSPCRPGMSSLEPTATLLDVLTGTTILNKESKIILAVVLAYSILYLAGSPWLPPYWDGRVFRFLRLGNEIQFNQLLRPLIPAEYVPESPLDSLRPGAAHGDPARLALGVTLLEIFRQQPIENLRQDQDIDYDEDGGITTDTNLYTAYRVHEREDWDVHEGYKKAILACLDDADVDGLPWSDMKHKAFIYDNIIQPLEQELEAQCNIAVEELDEEIARSGFVLNRGIIPKHNKQTQMKSIAAVKDPEPGNCDLGPVGCLPAIKDGVNDGIQKAQIHVDSEITGAQKALPLIVDKSALSTGVTPLLESLEPLTSVSMLSVAVLLKTPSSDSLSSSSGEIKFAPFEEPTESAIHHIITKSLHGFALFDNQDPSMNAAGRADSWFGHLDDILYSVIPPIPVLKDSRIKIAILDSGIDMGDRFIGLKSNRRRIQYRSFVFGDLSDKPEDLLGHGTHTAGLLLKVARNADIFVARITRDGNLQDPQQIAAAIRYATDEWGVDIITMSFGFPPLSEDLDCIQLAILAAQAKRVVMFAAARNSGGLKQIAYPADRPEVICINATDGEGNPSHFNPSAIKGKNFSTLGEDVLSSWPGTAQKRMSGTSFATPIAAGIAAIVMDFMVQVQQSKDWSKEARYHANKIKTREGIVQVFEKHLSAVRGGFRFLAPWQFFNEDKQGEIALVLLNTLRDV